jgi:hypothetical protein
VNEFREHLIHQALDSVPGWRILLLRSFRRITHNSDQVARMICHLRHLQIFHYEFACTDEVVEQLGLQCRHLKGICLYGSSSVTNASTEHLLRLKKIEFLDLEETEIGNEHYGLLLSELPIIENIQFWSTHGSILDHVAKENLPQVSHVRICIEDVSMLAQRCRNITNLDIWSISTNL